MRARQRGVTFIGFLMLAVVIGLLGYAALKLSPHYLENMAVQRVMNNVAQNLDGQGADAQSIRNAVKKGFIAETVSAATAKELEQAFKVSKSENGYLLQYYYEKREPYIANVLLVAVFEDEVEIRQ
jgi:Tfp pilus assembly major pilin PilA